MSDTDAVPEPDEPTVTDVPEPDQEPHEPIPDEADTEPDEDEPDEDAEPAVAEQPPEQHGPTIQEMERRFQKAEKRFETYVKAVTAIWEEEAIHLTPFNLGAMAPPGFIDMREAGRVPEENKTAILQFLGFAREQDYEPDPETQECPTCKGKGKTSTGSKVPGKETRACPRCKGAGATGMSLTLDSAPTNGSVEEHFTLASDEDKELSDQDNWGQPRILPDGRENPNWGRMPQYWVSVAPWGDTRNLPAQA